MIEIVFKAKRKKLLNQKHISAHTPVITPKLSQNVLQFDKVKFQEILEHNVYNELLESCVMDDKSMKKFKRTHCIVLLLILGLYLGILLKYDLVYFYSKDGEHTAYSNYYDLSLTDKLLCHIFGIGFFGTY